MARAAGQGEERLIERPVCLARKAGRQSVWDEADTQEPHLWTQVLDPTLVWTRSLRPAVPVVSVGLLLLLVGQHPDYNRSSWLYEF